MQVVSNTSPINYLLQIGAIEILLSLYGRIVTHPGGFVELNHARSPNVVRN